MARLPGVGRFSVSASLNGDKQVTLIGLQTLASQHGGIWVTLGLLPANELAAARNDANNLGTSVGLLVQAPSDADADAIPSAISKPPSTTAPVWPASRHA